MFFRRVVILLGLLAVTACGVAASGNGSQAPATVPVGGLPSTVATVTGDSSQPTSTVVRTTIPISPDAQVGSLITGNRVILIGDSVMASTSSRYGATMCNALVPLGWQVEVDAETGRFIQFGEQVLDKRLSAGWDVSVILLGNNYNGDQADYRNRLDHLVARLSPKPVVLLTVTEFEASRQKVNEVIFEMADKYPNVLIVDWGATTAADRSLTGGDGLHLTDAGRLALAEEVSLALGTSPMSQGKCLTTSFKDDSSGPVTGTTTTAPKQRHTTTTVKSTNTTVHTTSPPTDPPTTPPSNT